MYLASQRGSDGSSPPLLPLEFVKQAEPYFDAANRGLVRDLVILTVGLATDLYCHVAFSSLTATVPTTPAAMRNPVIDVAAIEEGIKLLGRPIRLVLGRSLVGFVLPPPSRKSLLGIVVIGTGAWIVKAALQ